MCLATKNSAASAKLPMRMQHLVPAGPAYAGHPIYPAALRNDRELHGRKSDTFRLRDSIPQARTNRARLAIRRNLDTMCCHLRCHERCRCKCNAILLTAQFCGLGQVLHAVFEVCPSSGNLDDMLVMAMAQPVR